MGALGYLQPLEDRTDIISIILWLFLMGLLIVYVTPFYLKPNYSDRVPNSKYTLWCTWLHYRYKNKRTA